jgi:hypothetical protein
MKRTRIISWIVALSVIFGFYGIAISGGGPEDPNCPEPLPAPNAGKFLRGEFSVAGDKGDCSVIYPEECPHYNVHFLLKWRNQTHLFSFMTPLGTGDLCPYTSEELKETFRRVPCGMGVGLAFGLSGVPVITNLEIVHQDFCGSPDEMIRGEIVIRVVPLE